MWHLSWQMLMGQQQPALSAQPLTSSPLVRPSTPALLERSAAQVHHILHEACSSVSVAYLSLVCIRHSSEEAKCNELRCSCTACPLLNDLAHKLLLDSLTLKYCNWRLLGAPVFLEKLQAMLSKGRSYYVFLLHVQHVWRMKRLLASRCSG